MAKYVGRIFKVDNAKLKLHGNGTHYVHVKWYNPFKRMFYCRVITTLEHKIPVDESDKDKFRAFAGRKSRGYHYLPEPKKYGRLQNGKITPIPRSQTRGFEYWCGYEESRYLSARTLKGKESLTMQIVRK